MKYAEKLKDPRWQKKRLEMMERDQWTCQYCGSKDDTLNVHHKMYLKGYEPWEYPDMVYVTCCEICHKEEHIKRPAVEKGVIKTLGLIFKNADELSDFLYTLVHYIDLYGDTEEVKNRISEFLQKGFDG